MNLNPKLVNLLACPSCKGAVEEGSESLVCQNLNCGLEYPVRDGIPVMLISEAKPKQS